MALVDRGALGVTCANTGCIPSRMLIFAADRMTEMEESNKPGIEAEVRAGPGYRKYECLRRDS